MSKSVLRLPKHLFSEKFLDYLFKIRKPIEVLFGGAGSGKTIHSAFKDVIRLLSGKNVLAVRQVYATLEDSYYSDVKKVIGILEVEKYFKFKKSPLKIECVTTGKVMLFRGLDDVEKIKGITVQNGSIDHITIEEVTETKEESTNQLQFRTRGGGEYIDKKTRDDINKKVSAAKSVDDLYSTAFKTSLELLLDIIIDAEETGKTLTLLFNPVSKNNWVFKRFFVDDEGNEIFSFDNPIYSTEQIYIMHSTHWDNPFLTLDDHLRYESYKFISPYFYNVYSLGRWGVLGNLIFTNVKIANFTRRFINNIPEQFVGLDFGSKDPNALMRVGIDRIKKEIYILDEYVKGDMTSLQLADVVKRFIAPNEVVWCDSAGRQQIADLISNGVRRAVGVSKYGGKNFKPHGIGVLWDYKIYVNVKCKVFANEISSYCWVTDKNGNVTGQPQDGNDHTIDSGLFYALNSVLINTQSSKIY